MTIYKIFKYIVCKPYSKVKKDDSLEWQLSFKIKKMTGFYTVITHMCLSVLELSSPQRNYSFPWLSI